MRKIFLIVLLLCWAVPAGAKVRTETVEYTHEGVVLEGYLAYDDSIKGRRPGVVIFHEWWGINDFIRGSAEELAGMGYVALAADIYGKGVRPTDSRTASAQAGRFKMDRALMRARARAGLDILKRIEFTNPKKTVAIGYGFGGTAALELARSGADVLGTVSFHGGLDTPDPRDAKRIKGRVLVLTGSKDPFVPPAQVRFFTGEMDTAGVDWFMVTYGGAAYSFANPSSGEDPSRGIAYDQKADMRSWREMEHFLTDIFR